MGMVLDGKRISSIDEMIKVYPGKFVSMEEMFKHIKHGNRIFIGTGCGEPQYLVKSMIDYVKLNPKSFFDAEIIHVWTLGVSPYAEEKFKPNFRQNSFFISSSNRDAINKGIADYTPTFISNIPDLMRRKLVPIDIALIQTSPPNHLGYMSLGISVDIVKAAIEEASLVIAQINTNMPWVHGDGFIHVDNVDFIIPYDEPLLEYITEPDAKVSQQIGKYVAKIIQDGDTIQVGYGSMPDSVLANLMHKKHLGVHTELLTDGIIELMKNKVIDNSQKRINVGKTIAAFCMGKKETYEYIRDNPEIEFKRIDYTNNPLIIAQHDNMIAINSALEIDLIGQMTAESLGKKIYSGIGGMTDFMRGANLARNGKTILTVKSTALNDTVSRIVPFLREGTRISSHAGDIQYVVTEYGIAYLYGKNYRERAMELISVAHPKFRSWLIDEAKKLNLIYKDQVFIPGEKGMYPEHLEVYRTTKTGLEILLRPIKISDEPLLKDFFYSLSKTSMFRRFMSLRPDMPHTRLQEYEVIDYTKEMLILAVLNNNGKEKIIGMGQYFLIEGSLNAEVAFAVTDTYQNQGIGKQLLTYLTILARKQGLNMFIAEVLKENLEMLHLFEKTFVNMEKMIKMDIIELKIDLAPDYIKKS
jgi:acyl-CoA hydrolase/GNAT superfamily N-acetyltransferase